MELVNQSTAAKLKGDKSRGESRRFSRIERIDDVKQNEAAWNDLLSRLDNVQGKRCLRIVSTARYFQMLSNRWKLGKVFRN